MAFHPNSKFHNTVTVSVPAQALNACILLCILALATPQGWLFVAMTMGTRCCVPKSSRRLPTMRARCRAPRSSCRGTDREAPACLQMRARCCAPNASCTPSPQGVDRVGRLAGCIKYAENATDRATSLRKPVAATTVLVISNSEERHSAITSATAVSRTCEMKHGQTF